MNHNLLVDLQHCVKSVHIWSIFRSVLSCIWNDYREIRTRKKLFIWTLFTPRKNSSKRRKLSLLGKSFVIAFRYFTILCPCFASSKKAGFIISIELAKQKTYLEKEKMEVCLFYIEHFVSV